MINIIFREGANQIVRLLFPKTVPPTNLPNTETKIVAVNSEDTVPGIKRLTIPDQSSPSFTISGSSGEITDDLTFATINFNRGIEVDRLKRMKTIMHGTIHDEEGGTMPNQHVQLEIIGNADLILPGELKIIFINANPTGDDLPLEVIWIVNASTGLRARTIDLNGCRITHEVFGPGGVFRRQELFYQFTDTLLLPPVSGSNTLNICMVYTRARNSQDANNPFIRFAGYGSPKWNNTGDTARIFNPPDFNNNLLSADGPLIDMATYHRGQSVFIEPTPQVRNRLTISVNVPWANGTSWDGNGNFIDTGLLIKQDDTLNLITTGSIWSGFLDSPENGPDGSTVHPPKQPNLASDDLWPFKNGINSFAYCVIAKIGVTGEPFLVGSSRFIEVNQAIPTGGLPLFLAINDERPFMNPPPPRALGHGFFSCTITLESIL